MKRGTSAVALVAVVLLLVGVAAGASALWSRGSLNALICGGDCDPSAMSTPDALARDGLPGPADPREATPGRLDPAAIEAAVRDELGSEDLGRRVGFAAVDPSTGETVSSIGDDAYVPASTTKLLTGLAALTVLDPQLRFSTRVIRKNDRIVLIGGGDPYLATRLPRQKVYAVNADLRSLATQAAAELRRSGTTAVRLDYETSLFMGPRASPTWEKSYIGQRIVTPVSALMVDGGAIDGTRVDYPSKATAELFARQLERRGIDVVNSPIETKAPTVSDPIAVVRSATVAQIVESMIAQSDNEAAESLLRQVAIGAGLPPTFEGGVEAVRDVLERLEIDTTGLVLHDGSGLSRENRISPQTLAEVVAAAASEDRTDRLVSDLAVGGFTGTLARRFAKAESGRGVVRGKSGTLTGVHSLAGYVTDRAGTPIAFAVMTDATKSVNPFVTEDALDRVAAALAECTCSR